MSASTPIARARVLASVYGRRFDHEPLTYPQGVALAGRLRLAAIDGDAAEVGREIARLVEPVLLDRSVIPDNGPCLSVACFADELFEVTGDERHRAFLVAMADRFLEKVGFDDDVRVEDFFFGGTLLGRAHRLTGRAAYADRLMAYLDAADTQQADGLYWHCHASPYYWGRGNAFAAFGIAEALTHVPDHPLRDRLVARNGVHLDALVAFQDASGLWRQVVDDPASYLEHSATTMLGYAIARGLRGGWLDGERLRAALDRAWDGIAVRTGPAGELEKVCASTGPLDSLDAYVNRPFNDGFDERGGAMALWFATALAAPD